MDRHRGPALTRRGLLAGIAAATAVAASPSLGAPAPAVPPSDKRGFAGSDTRRGNALGAAWSYNWSISTDQRAAWDHDAFVPMINGDDLGWVPGAVDRLRDRSPAAVLGFNEPDHEEGIDLSTALDHWRTVSTLADAGVTVVSPSIKVGTAGGREYFRDFVDAVESDAELVVDEVAVHWYAGSQAMQDDPMAQAEAVLDRVEWVHDQTDRPVWITEFGGPDFGDASDVETLTESNRTFLARTVPELEAREYVRRYSWWAGSPETDLTTVTDGDVSITGVGEAYVTSAARSEPAVEAGVYRIEAAHSGQALTVADGATDEGARVVQQPAGAPGQRVRVRPQGDGTALLEAVHSGHVLEVSEEATDAGATIDQWPANDGAHQRWYLVGNLDGTVRIENANSHRVIDVADGSTDAGAECLQWNWIGGENQRFEFVDLETTATTENTTTTPTLESIDGTVPRDPDDDGLYEDIDGSGELAFPDVNRLFQHTDSAAVTDHVDAYDYSGDGRITLQDVMALFEMV